MLRVTLAQAAHFVMKKNHLVLRQAGSVETLAGQLVGLPANPVTTPVLAARARLAGMAASDLSEAGLITSLLMRGVYYKVPVADFVNWYAATARQRNQSQNAELRLWGIENNLEIERLGNKVLEVFDARPATAAEITDRLSPTLVRELTQTSRGGRVSTTTNVSLALRWLVLHGRLITSNAGDNWWIDRPVYHRLDSTFPKLDLSRLPGEAEAQKLLARAFIARYGPVSEADVSFWTGFGKSETARATGALAGETVLTMVDGIPGMLFLLREQADALRAAAPSRLPLICVLPADDPYLVAYRASRTRYFSDQTLQRHVFSGSGAAKPAILVNGQIAGTWGWQIDEGRHRLSWGLLTDVERDVTSLIQVEVEKVAAFIDPQATTELRD